METVELGTFADNDDQFCRVFTVPKDWLIDILERLDGFNEQHGVDLENFFRQLHLGRNAVYLLLCETSGVCIE